MFQFFKRWFGGATAYQPGTGRIVYVQHNASSGVNITPDSAMTIPAFFHAMRTYGQVIGSLHWNLIHHLQRGQEIARTHPVHRLLHDDPNEFQSAPEWRELMVSQAISYGNSFSYIVRNGNFRPTALMPLLPDRTKPVINEAKNLVYRTVVDGQQIDLDPYDIFHFKGFSGNAISGFPLVQLMRDSLGLSKAEEEYAAKYFSNPNPGGVMTVPGALSDKARQNLKESMEREYGGLANAFRTIFVEDGVKYEPIEKDAQKAQMVESRSFQLGDMARVVGLAPHLLYDLSRSTNNNIEHQGREAVTYSFGPVANRLCHEANRKLLYESEKDEYETSIDLAKLMEGDAQSQAVVDKANFDMLALTPNERRAKIGLNPIDGGDSLFLNTAYLPLDVAIQKALAPAPGAPAGAADGAEPNQATADDTSDAPPADPSKGIKEPDGEPGPDVPPNVIDGDLNRSIEILRPVVSAEIARILRREQKAIENARAKFADNPQGFGAWYEKWEQEQREHIADVLQPTGEAMRAAGLKLNGYVESHLAESRADVLAGKAEWGRDRIEKAVSHLLEQAK